MSTPAGLPERALDTTAESPWPVRVLSLKIADYVEKMSPLWVEGEIVSVNRRGATAYLTIRDPEVDMSLAVSISTYALDALPGAITPGLRVVLHAKTTYWPRRGTLQLEARQIRPVGVGDILARVEVLRQRLAAEGLFDAARKSPLPFLPRGVGLVTGRESAAERDVVVTARARWPQVRFVLRPVAVQGSAAVSEVCAALAELDRDPTVDVVIVARGGGSAEELLAFSNETLLRAVAAMATPVVSAIGHESDTPLLDHIADVRASTPTDAGRRVVPDTEAERRRLGDAVARGRGGIRRRLENERRALGELTARPVMRGRGSVLAGHRETLAALRATARRRLVSRLDREHAELTALHRHGRSLSPSTVLDRGFALVQHGDGRLVLGPDEVGVDELLRIRVARGIIAARALAPGTAGSAGLDR